MQLRFGSPDFPRLHRLLIAGSLIGSAIYGWQHMPLWLIVPPAALAGYLVLEDRAVGMEVGIGAWPSKGYQRFLRGTNLFSLLWNSLLSAGLFTLAGIASSALIKI